MANTTVQTQVAVIATKVENIENKINEINNKMDGHFITREEFDPIKRLVYGVVSLILTAVIIALVGLVVMKP